MLHKTLRYRDNNPADITTHELLHHDLQTSFQSISLPSQTRNIVSLSWWCWETVFVALWAWWSCYSPSNPLAVNSAIFHPTHKIATFPKAIAVIPSLVDSPLSGRECPKRSCAAKTGGPQKHTKIYHDGRDQQPHPRSDCSDTNSWHHRKSSWGSSFRVGRFMWLMKLTTSAPKTPIIYVSKKSACQTPRNLLHAYSMDLPKMPSHQPGLKHI